MCQWFVVARGEKGQKSLAWYKPVQLFWKLIRPARGDSGKSQGKVGLTGPVVSRNSPGSLSGIGAETRSYALKGLLRGESEDVTSG